MNKKDYVDAINQINVTENQKKEVLLKMNEKKNKIGLKLSLCAACVVAITIGTIIPTRIMQNKEVNEEQKKIYHKIYQM